MVVIGSKLLAEEKIAPEVSELQTFVQAVGGAEALDDAVEPIQQGDPVIQVTPWEGPSRRKLVEMLW